MSGAASGDLPTGLPDDLGEALHRLAGAGSLLVALDFDGVVAPIVEKAGAARALPASAEAVEALARADRVAVALVSGRSMASLREVSGPPAGALLVASHGAEGDGVPTDLTPEQASLLERLVGEVTAVVEAHPGTEVEHKPAGVVLHTRRAPRDAAAASARAVLDGPARRDGVKALEGKEVVELSVVDADKGRALVALRDRLAGSSGARPAVLFVGDDVTDENGFRALEPGAGDVGVKVGDGATAAGFRVGTPEDVTALLQRLLADVLTSRG